MPLDRFQKESLDVFEEIMDGRDQNYMYTGSTAMALHGIDIYPSDIDIVASEDTFDEITNLFPDENNNLFFPDKNPEKVEKTTYNGKANMATATILSLDIGTTEFEIIKDAKYHLNGENFDLEECSSDEIEYEGRSLNVITPEDLKEIYEIGGLKEKADQVAEYIGQQEVLEKGRPNEPIEYLELSDCGRKYLMEEETSRL